MKGFQPCKLGELLRVEHGFAFKGEHFSDSGRHIVLTPGNFFEQGGFKLRPGKDRYYQSSYPPRYLLKKDALIVAMTEQGEGLLGSAAIVPEHDRYLHNQRIGLVRANKGLAESNFLYYLFNTNSVRQQIRNSSAGTKIRHTSPERMYGVDVVVPDLATQQKIAAILSTYDDLIANNQRRITLLERMAEDLYREWFVRLRFPGHESVKVEKGVPQGWKFAEIGSLCVTLKRGVAPIYTESKTTLVINQRCIRDGFVELAEARGHATKVPNEKLIQYGDVLINSKGVGTLGRVAVFDLELASATCDTHVTICRADPKEVAIHYFGQAIRSLQSHFENMAVGSTGQSELGRDAVGRTMILLPPLLLQKSFAAAIEPMLRRKRLLRRQTEALAATRDSLLPRLISGKLSVDALDIRFPPGMQEQSA